MRDILRWLLHWLSAPPLVEAERIVYRVEMETRIHATEKVETRLRAKATVEA